MLPVRLRLTTKTIKPKLSSVVSFSSVHLKVMFTSRPEDQSNKWMVVVPKIVIKHAVDRNHTKRIIRETIRRHHHEFPPGDYQLKVAKTPTKLKGTWVDQDVVTLKSLIQKHTSQK